MKLLFRLAFTIITIALLALAVIIYVTWLSNVKTLDTLTKERLEELAAHTMDKVDLFMFERIADLQAMAKDPVINSRDSSPQQITERLIEYRNIYKSYISLSFLDLNRVRIADTNSLRIGQQDNMSGYWEDILKTGISTGADIHFSEDLNTAAIYFASVVKDKDNLAFGVLVTLVEVDKLYSIIGKISVVPSAKESMRIDLVDKNGLLIYSTRHREEILKGQLDEWEAVKRGISGELIGIVESHRHPGEEKTIAIFCREQGYLDFKSNEWTLIIHIPNRIVFTPIRELGFKWFLVILPSVLLAIIIALFFVIIYSKPLSELTQGIIEVGKGNLDIHLKIGSLSSSC